jgi:UDP-glucose:(heptosyl)LPS alpha-1,3-glucosyltransferase
MKLAIVRQKYTPFGGAERFVERALGALKSQGTDVSIIARQWSGDVKGITCNPFYLGRTWRDASFAHCVQRILASGEFDLIQSHERIPGCDIYRAGDGVHATWLELRNKPLDALSPWHRYTLAAEEAMFRHPKLRAVICNSRMVRDDIANRFGVPDEKLHVIYNGVDLEKYHPRIRTDFRDLIRSQLCIPAEATLLLYVGSGFARKGVDWLLRVFSTIKVSNARLVVVGGDRHIDGFRKQAKMLGIDHTVNFLGAVNDVRPYYAAADGFVLPTIYDPCPNAILEALACGLPTVTTNYCGASEWLSQGINGCVVDVGADESLRKSLEWLCADGRLASASHAARQSVSGLGLDTMVARLSGLYRFLYQRRN